MTHPGATARRVLSPRFVRQAGTRCGPGIIARDGLVSRHSHLGKPPALPEDCSSSTISGWVRRAAWDFAPFPLTPALSLGERVKPALPAEPATSVRFPLRPAP